jgi:hypothetical protein
MTDPNTILDSLAKSPDWFCHQLDLDADRALLVRLEPAAIRAAAFLDERVLAGRSDGFRVPLATLRERAQPCVGHAPHAIFHIGHCGSTLLARVLGELPGLRVLREPLPLRTLAALYEEMPLASARIDAAQWRALADAVLGLMARRGPDDSDVLAKATSSCNALIDPWLARDPRARALLLTIDLPDYLAAILKAPGARADALRFAPARLAFLQRWLGDDALRLPPLATAERIALGWIAEAARYADAQARHGARVLQLDFAAFLANRDLVLARLAMHLGIAADADARARALAPAQLDRYAKATEHAYDAQARAADLAESARRFAPELRAGVVFARDLTTRYPALARLESLSGSLRR